MTIASPAVPATAVATPNPYGQWASVAILTGTVQSVIVTPPFPPAVLTPAVPATTVTATNSNTFPVQVVIGANGSTITAVTVNGSGVGTAAGTYVVPAAGTVSITYTVATPTWVWTAIAYGVSGSPIGSLPQSYPVPPGCSITLLFTSTAPTWAWTNPVDEGYTPGYYAMNTGAEAAGYNPYTVLQNPQHATLAQTGLATGVAN